VLFRSGVVFDGDIILHGSVNIKGRYSIAGHVFIPSGGFMRPTHGGILLIEPEWFSGAILYGPGTFQLGGPNSALRNASGTWVNVFQVASIQLDNGATTGTSYAGGVFTDGRALTQANLDLYRGLQNPVTGSRYTLD
jgi:hypothetical protein